MTIPAMKRATGALLLVVAAAALFLSLWGRETSNAATEAAAEQAVLLQEAQTQIDALEDRTEQLEAELAEATAEAAGDDLDLRLDRASERLWASVTKLREALSETKAAGDSAAEDAGSALANASAALRDLTILENRFEYHLRRHGGG